MLIAWDALSALAGRLLDEITPLPAADDCVAPAEGGLGPDSVCRALLLAVSSASKLLAPCLFACKGLH